MIDRQHSKPFNRVRAGSTTAKGVTRLWRPVTDSWIGSFDDRLWQCSQTPAVECLDRDSWIARRHDG